jgi:Coenzyme PQQ synthesis protein D (PqqD)
VANSPGSSENHPLDQSELLYTSFLRAAVASRESGIPAHHEWITTSPSEGQAMIKVAPHVQSIVDHDGAVILDMPRNAMTTVDSTGGYIWERLQQGLQIDAIIAQLSRDTGADELVVARDVEEFMEQLKSRHLISLG